MNQHISFYSYKVRFFKENWIGVLYKTVKISTFEKSYL